MKRTVSQKTAETLRTYLYHVIAGDGVMTGTGSAAGVEGYKIGGKTGTAEKIPRDKKNYVVSFLGAAPIDNPQVVLYVWWMSPTWRNSPTVLTPRRFSAAS